MHLFDLIHNNMVIDLLFNRMIVLEPPPKNTQSKDFCVNKLILVNVVLSLIMNVVIISYIAYRVYFFVRDKWRRVEDKTVTLEPRPSIIEPLERYKAKDRASNRFSRPSIGDAKRSAAAQSVRNVNINQFYNQTELSILNLSESRDVLRSRASFKDRPLYLNKERPLYLGKTNDAVSMQEKILSEMMVSPSMQNMLLARKKSSKQSRRNIL